MNRDRKPGTAAWLWVSLAGFVLFALFFAGLLLWGQRIELSMPVYFFLVVLLALFATAFLAGAMRSAAKYSATWNNKSLQVAGPAVIFFIIVYLGYQYRPENKSGPLALSILVTGPDKTNDLIRSGEVGIRVGDISFVKAISNEGVAYFSGINADYRGRSLEIFPRVAGYYLDSGRQFFLSETEATTNLTVSLRKQAPQLSLNGKVLNLKKQQGIAGAEVRFEGVDTVYTTDANGSFHARLPLPPDTEVRVLISQGPNVVYNSLRTLPDKGLLTFAITDR